MGLLIIRANSKVRDKSTTKAMAMAMAMAMQAMAMANQV